MGTLNDTALGNDNSSGTVLATDDALNVTAGDLVYVAAKWESSNGATPSFDTGPSTPSFSVACALVDSTATDMHSATAYWIADAGGTVTPRLVLDSARSYRALKAFSVTPASGKTWSLGNVASNASISGGSSNAPSSGAAAATGPGVAFGSFGIYSSLTLTPGAGWTQPAEFNSASFVCAEYQIVGAAGSLTADGTLSGSPHWIAMLAIFNEVDSGGGGPGPIGQVTETDVAMPFEVVDPSQVGDLLYFGDTAGNESSAGGSRLVGGFPGAGASTLTVGQPSESDSAQPMGRSQLRSLGQASETDSAQPLAAVRTLAIGQPSESDTALPLAQIQARSIGQAIETDAAQPFAGLQLKSIGQVAETDSAEPFALSTAKIAGQASETDNAQALASLLARAIGQASELDSAQPFTVGRTQAIGQVAESDSAQPLVRLQARPVGQPVETDSAQPFTGSVPGGIGQAVETDAAQAFIARQARAVGQASEADSAQPVGLSTAKIIGQASESDAAQAFVARLLRQVGQPLESDAAQPLGQAQAHAIGQPSELDTALAVAQRQLRAIGIAVELDSAQPFALGGAGSSAGLVLVGGTLQYKAAPSAGDLLLFLGPDGLVHARTAAAPGDRRLTTAGGLLKAGAPA